MNFDRLLRQLRAVRDAHVGMTKTLEIMIAEVEREKVRGQEDFTMLVERDRDFWDGIKDIHVDIASTNWLRR